MQAVTVFMGSQMGCDPAYQLAAQQLGKEIANRQLTLVYGGGKCGLMWETAQSAVQAGGTVVGITPRNLAEEAITSQAITRLIEVDTMDERKQKLLSYGDAYIVLPGGFGTLEELAQVISWTKIGLQKKPLILLNINGFYDDVWSWINHSVEQGFAVRSDMELIKCVDSVQQAMAYIKSNK